LPSYAEGKGDTLSLSDAVNTSLSGGQEAAIKRALTWFEDNFGMTKDDAARVIKNSKQLVADLNAGGIGSLAPQTIVTIGSTSALLNEASKHLSDDQYATLLLHHRAQFEDALLGTIDETVAGILELVGAASTPIPVAGVEVAVTPEVKTELAFLVNAVAARVAARRVQELVDLLD
jgi:hypothetical protein